MRRVFRPGIATCTARWKQFAASAPGVALEANENDLALQVKIQKREVEVWAALTEGVRPPERLAHFFLGMRREEL
jgi:hypothetical protein